MGKSKVSIVGAAEVREAYRSGRLDASKVKDAKGNPVNTGCLTGGPQGRGRGRMNPALVAHFLDNTPGTEYAEKVTTVKTTTLPVTRTNARGAVLKRPVEVPTSEARTLAGKPGSKGRLSQADLEKAAAAFMAQRDSE